MISDLDRKPCDFFPMRLEGSTDAANVAMRRAFEKAGWSFEGTMKNLFLENSVGHDYLSFAKTI